MNNFSHINYDTTTIICNYINNIYDIFRFLETSKIFKKQMFKFINIYIYNFCINHTLNLSYISDFIYTHKICIDYTANHTSLFQTNKMLKIENIINIKTLLHLNELHINYSSVEYISDLYIPNLQKLSLTCCYKLQDFHILNNFKQLKKLRLNNTLFEDINDISNLSNSLRYLSLRNCYKLRNYHILNTFKNLTTLDLSNTRIDDLCYISNLSNNLTKLNLKDCYAINDFSLLSSFINLQHLNLQSTYINDIFILSPLTNLKYLNIYDCIILLLEKNIHKIYDFYYNNKLLFIEYMNI